MASTQLPPLSPQQHSRPTKPAHNPPAPARMNCPQLSSSQQAALPVAGRNGGLLDGYRNANAEKNAGKTYAEKYEKQNAAFRMIDTDGSASISREEMTTMLHALNPGKFDNDLIDSIMKQVDADGSGDIDMQEFVPWLCGLTTMEQGMQEAFHKKAAEGLMPALFKKADADGNGTLSRDEFVDMLRFVNPTAFNQDYVDVMLTNVSFDKDGMMSLKDFKTWVTGFTNSETMEDKCVHGLDQMTKIFRECDSDGNGVIERDEMKTLLKKLNPKGFTDANLDLLMDQIDSNGDGIIDYNEFCTWLMDTGVVNQPKAPESNQKHRHRHKEERSQPASPTEHRHRHQEERSQPASPTALQAPPGWEAVMSKSKGKVYYVNQQTGETVWDRPSGGSPVAADRGKSRKH